MQLIWFVVPVPRLILTIYATKEGYCSTLTLKKNLPSDSKHLCHTQHS